MIVRLSLEYKDIVEEIFKEDKSKSFYHYFPLLYAIDQSTESIFIDSYCDGVVWSKYPTELYYIFDGEIPETVEKVLISERKSPWGWIDEIYDVNFIFDIDTTVDIKNFRDNIKKFLHQNPNIEYIPATQEMAVEMVSDWYKKRQNGGVSYTDFGYTYWLAKNFQIFEDIRARAVILNGKVSAISMWGKLDNNIGIHLICKDRGIPYLQDYTRFQTYNEMKDIGLKYVNDGSDCSQEGIRVYKQKLRPKFIIPIYSWIKVVK